MNNNYSPLSGNELDEIIRELPSYPKSRDEFENNIIIIDVKSGEILDEPPLFSFKKVRYFQINRNKVIFSIQGPQINIKYSDSENPFKLTVNYDAKINEKGSLKLVRFVNNSNSPLSTINGAFYESISSYIFNHENFVTEYNSYKLKLQDIIKEQGLKYGLDVKPYLIPNVDGKSVAFEFIDVQHNVMAKTSDAQTVEIKHDLALTLSDPIKFSLSGIKDIKIWAKLKLDQYTSNAIIDINYADVLVNMDKSIIKGLMEKASMQIGYKLKQLISLPGHDNERFYFETADESLNGNKEYGTKDSRFKIAVNIIVNGRLDLQNTMTKRYIKPGHDIILSMKKNVIEYAKLFLNEKTPEECFLKLFELEDELVEHVRKQLNLNYGFNDLGITIKFLETDLSKRFSFLQERPYQIEVLGDFLERRYILWFRVVTVSPDGWFRFRANNYSNTEDELKDIARMVKNGMTNLFSSPSKINGQSIVQEFTKLQNRVRDEFGLEIKLHDFTEGISDEEVKLAEGRKVELREKGKRHESILISETDELNDLLDKRRLAKQAEESDEIIKKLDEKIEEIKRKTSFEKENYLKQKTTNDFLLPSHSFESIDKKESDEKNKTI
jgi:hypothetical protein